MLGLPKEGVLGQAKVADKSNEINASPELVEMLDITGCIVTIDAIGTQTEIAKKIEGGDDYLLTLKENQGHQFEDIRSHFDVDVSQGIEDTAYKYAKIIVKDMDGLKPENVG